MPDSTEAPEAHAHDAAELERLRARLEEMQRERDHLIAVVDILQEISASLHFVDILQTIARKLGESFGLDRCAIFLSGNRDEVRLVASYEDPTIRNLVVDLKRYPELQRAFDSGETVFIPDAASDPSLKSIRAALDTRNVRSIVVVPIQWQSQVIGAIFLRTERDAQPFSEADVRFCQVIASLTAKALHNAHRYEAALQSQQSASTLQQQAGARRVALVAFLQRLLRRYAEAESSTGAELGVSRASDEELDRLVSVAMQVLDEEAKG